MKKLTLSVVVLGTIAAATTARATEHIAEINVSVAKGKIGSHFSVFHGYKTIEIQGHKISIPYTSDFTKLANRDDDTTPITPAKPWKTTVNFDGGGVYVFDISDWRDNPTASVSIKVDGKVCFEGSGSADNYNKWTDKHYGNGVRKTDDREIAFELK